MTPTLKSATTVYELGIDELKIYFAHTLGVQPEQITIKDRTCVTSSDPLDRWPTVYGFDGITIIVQEKK